jgi:hypothetical protein
MSEAKPRAVFISYAREDAVGLRSAAAPDEQPEAQRPALLNFAQADPRRR